MSTQRTLFFQSFHYFYGRLLLLLGSFISFPILTRILTIEDYGILSYISTIAILLGALSKLGLQHSAIRFYPEFNLKKLNSPISHFYSTLYFVPIIFGTLITCIIITIIILGSHFFNEKMAIIFILVALSVPLGAGISTFSQFLRAEQKVRFFNLIALIEKYSSLFLGIAFVLLITRDVMGLYYAGTICIIFLFIFATVYLYTKRDLSVRCISMDFLKRALLYGAPLIGYEFFAQILEYGDRVLLKSFIGLEAVAIYSVGYNIPMYISELFGTSLRLAIVPLYLALWSEKGIEATQEFLSRTLSYFALIVIPIIFGVWSVKKEMIILLASEKFIFSHQIVPYVLFGTMLYSANAIIAAGLFIYKKTHLLTVSLISGAILNICLNLFLIPRLGVKGSAIATLIAYMFVFFSNAFLAFRYVAFTIDYKSIFIAFFASLVMFFMVEQIIFKPLIYNLICKIAIGILSYGFLLILLHKRTRSDFASQIRKLSKKFIKLKTKEDASNTYPKKK